MQSGQVEELCDMCMTYRLPGTQASPSSLKQLRVYIYPLSSLPSIFLLSSSNTEHSTNTKHHFQLTFTMETIKNAANYVTESVKGAGAETSKQTHKVCLPLLPAQTVLTLQGRCKGPRGPGVQPCRRCQGGCGRQVRGDEP